MNATVTFDTGNFTVVVIGLLLIVCGLLWVAYHMGMEKSDYENWKTNNLKRGKMYFDTRSRTWMEMPPHDD